MKKMMIHTTRGDDMKVMSTKDYTCRSSFARWGMRQLYFTALAAGLILTSGLLKIPAAEAAISYVNSVTVCGNTANQSVNVPAGTRDGDVMIMVINSKDGTAQTTPSGWTQIGTSVVQGTTIITSIYRRVANNEPASYTPTTTAISHCLGIATYRGVDTTTPINASSQLADTGADTTNNASAITPTTINTEVLFIIGDAQEGTHSAFSGTNPTFTVRFDVNTTLGTDNSIALASGPKTDTTSTGARTATSTIAAVSNGFLVALAPIIKTTPGLATATAAGSTSILVTMPYTDDMDGDNSYSIRYKLSSSGTWGGSTNYGHSASPFTTTLSPLTDSQVYDVEMTYSDPDGVISNATQTAWNVVLGPSVKTTAGNASARPTPAGVKVKMPYYNDTNRTSQYTVEYKLTSNPSYSSWVTSAPTVTSPYTTTITGLTTTRYDVRVTYLDPTDGVVAGAKGATQTFLYIPANSLLHNTYTTVSSKWSSSWGIYGGQYGEFACDTCHSKSTTNIKRVKTTITAPAGSFPGSTVDFRSVTTPSGFGDDTSTHSTSQKVCEICHSQTDFHKYNQAAATHQNNTDCLSNCHNHNLGFSGDGPCKSCHNAAINEAYNTRQVAGAGGDFVRLSHHVNDGSTNERVTDYDCIVCHAEGDALNASAGEGYVDLTLHRNGSSASTRMVKLRNVDDYNKYYDWNKNSPTGGMRDNMDTFCMNCHDSNGASQIAVANGNPPAGILLGSAVTSTLRSGTTVSANIRPFNQLDTLRGNTTDVSTLGPFRSTTYGRVLNVKDQFNSGSASGKSWASHHNLNQFTKRYVTKNTTNWPTTRLTGYQTREGKFMNGTANGDGETAGLHCSDCHLNETNAHGAVNSRYMLDNGTVDQTDTDAAWTGGDGGTHVCYKCHNTTTYGAGGTGTPQTFDHSDDAGNTFGEIGSPMGIVCFNCHGGYSSGSQGGLGAIHGTNETYIPGGATLTSKRYRFMSGSIMRFYRPALAGTGNIADTNWEDATNSSCYTTAPDTWHVTTCNQHSTGRDTAATAGNRPLEQP